MRYVRYRTDDADAFRIITVLAAMNPFPQMRRRVTMDRTVLSELIRAAILQRAGIPADARAIAEATFATWHVISAQLVPVIGVRGLDVLFTRALHEASTAVVGTEETGTFPENLPLFQEFLRKQSSTAATEASTAVLVGFTAILATFIGAAMTDRLLAPIWGIRREGSA